MFWNSTPDELKALFDAYAAEERKSNLRAGLIAATIVNVNRKPGARMIRPEEFFPELPKPEDYLGVEQATALMDGWAHATTEEAQV